MKLSELQNNQKGIITKVRGRGAFRKRIIEMGFVKGKEVMPVRLAPLKDPVEYTIMGYEISLRRSEAELIEIETETEAEAIQPDKIYMGTIPSDEFTRLAIEKGKIINVALVGNPNCGKTTLFNYASGAKEHVGNYSGVTVDSKTAKFKQNGYTFIITDLPGTYSLTAYSPEELYVRKYIIEQTPDIVLNVLDASNLERNLYLTTQLIDMDIRVVCSLNMYDELLEKGDRLDFDKLGNLIGIPFVPTVSSKGTGIKELFDKVIQVYEDQSNIFRHIHINYGDLSEKAIASIQSKLKTTENKDWNTLFSSRFLAIKLLEKDKDANDLIIKFQNAAEIQTSATTAIKNLEIYLDEDSETIITDAKYGFISGAIKETFIEGISSRRKKTEIIDTFLTHKLFGFPVFIFFMWLMFQSTFSLGQYPMDWIESLVTFISSLVHQHMPEGMLKDLIIDGILGGVGGVIVFLPNILILFLFISIMEDTGYMARVAFIMDKIMHKIGLHGKSFIPLLMGFGCNVPAIMSTKTIENRNDRLLTMLINPFMSCSARLPVYLVVIGAVFSKYAGLILFSIYITGILVAILFAIIFKKTLFSSEEVPFVMELPPYRIPTFKAIVLHMWHKAQQYLRKMGGIILISSVIIWALGYFPRTSDDTRKIDIEISQMTQNYQLSLLSVSSETEKKEITQNLDSMVTELKKTKESFRQSSSYIGKMGHFIEPLISPMGFDWKMGVSLIAGVAGKAIVVSTMGVLYQVGGETEAKKESIKTQLQNEVHSSGKLKGTKVFTPQASLAFLIFILIYFPCIATIAAIKKESGSWKWALFTMGYTSALAWFLAFLVYQIGNIF